MYNKNSNQGNQRSGRNQRNQSQRSNVNVSDRDRRIMSAGSDMSYGKYAEDYDFDASESRLNEDETSGRRGNQSNSQYSPKSRSDRDQESDSSQHDDNYSAGFSNERRPYQERNPSWYSQKQQNFGSKGNQQNHGVYGENPQVQNSSSQSYGESGYGTSHADGSTYGTGAGSANYGSSGRGYGAGGNQSASYGNYYGNDAGRMTNREFEHDRSRTSGSGDFRSYANYGSEGGGSTFGASNQSSNWVATFGRQSADFRGKGPKGYQRSDDRIKEEICDILEDHSEIDASEIEVKVAQGEVTLTGTVHERKAKRVIEEALDQIRGLKDIHNQIRVSAQDYSKAQTSGVSQSSTSAKSKSGSEGSSYSSTAGKQQDAQRTTHVS